ncbi:dephospho-CoA kinase [Agreia pratensis]|uniref:dephospho-CoA kinase n=1 Tax=Agreia pratensis TaxID=150121 RepID=UPI00188A191F|nr:dephospho-CoA kinase [Agreia pratensis]MBF4634105.1 dephospho-CoA kinase [Agreia pratensis]
MYIVGLTGGIASGKSTVAQRLVEHGAVHVDADALSREAVEPGSQGLAAVAAEFGATVLAPDGSLDRAALGAIVFADPDARGRLEGIIHPRVHARTAELIASAEAVDPAAVVVYDVPLLVEARRELQFDLIVVCEAPVETRINRLLTHRGMPRAEAERRISAQASDDERRAVADVVIDTSGSLQHTLDQVDALWADLSARAQDRARVS